MYNLIWRSVTCRPGNGGLLSGMKRPIIAQTIATARRCDPIKDHTVASVVPPIGLHLHSGTTLATLSHPDCRSVLTLIVAGYPAVPLCVRSRSKESMSYDLGDHAGAARSASRSLSIDRQPVSGRLLPRPSEPSRS